MARSYARILTTIWNDRDFINLHSGAQRLFLVALTQPDLSLCGVLSFTVRRWAGLAPDTTWKDIARWIKVLVREGLVVVDEDTEELWVRNFTRYDKVLAAPNAIVGMAGDFTAIHSKPIRHGFLNGLPEGFWNGFDKPNGIPLVQRFPEPFTEALAEHFPNTFPLAYARDVRAHAGPQSSATATASPAAAPPAAAGGNPSTNGSNLSPPGQHREGNIPDHPDPYTHHPLVDRICQLYPPKPRWRGEAANLLADVLPHVDDRIVDEAIGRALEHEGAGTGRTIGLARRYITTHANAVGITLPAASHTNP